jgi:hypothetical protein
VSCTVAVRAGTIAAIADFGADLPADRMVSLALDEVLVTPGCSGSSASWPIPVSRSSRTWSRAALVGLDRKAPSRWATTRILAVFAPDETLVVDPNVLYHKNAVTPYAGRTLTGRVRSTWLRGTDISADVETNGDRRGRLLSRG